MQEEGGLGWERSAFLGGREPEEKAQGRALSGGSPGGGIGRRRGNQREDNRKSSQGCGRDLGTCLGSRELPVSRD